METVGTAYMMCVPALLGCYIMYEKGILTGMSGDPRAVGFLLACVNCITCMRSFPMKTALGANLIIAKVP